MRLTQDEIEHQNACLLLRREQLRRAAVLVSEAFAEEPGVERVALFGSVAKPPWKEVPRFRAYRRARVEVWHECKDVDLAVWLRPFDDDPRLLARLRRTLVRTLGDLLRDERIGVANHQVEVFLLEPGTDRYLGRLCYFSACPKKQKRDCLVPGCGAVAFLQQHDGFRFFDDALDGAIVLYDRDADPQPDR
jgi:predicted nucleotidyltransferase